MPQLLLDAEVCAPPFEITGPRGAPVIVALGGISAHRHVCASASNPAHGWWEGIGGQGRALDTDRYRVLSFDFIDGGERRDGRPERCVTTHDQASALADVMQLAGVDRVHAVVGASYGGMVALAFAARYPERLDRLVVIGAAHEAHPMTTAVRSVQRQIVELGLDTGRAREALSIARSLAMTTYRSAREFGERFRAAPVSIGDQSAEFDVESYLRHHGERFANTWTAARFLALSLSSDLHSVDPTRICTRTSIVACEGDAIVPRSQLEQLTAAIRGSRLVDLASIHGHDAFLTEPDSLGTILTGALAA